MLIVLDYQRVSCRRRTHFHAVILVGSGKYTRDTPYSGLNQFQYMMPWDGDGKNRLEQKV